MEKADFYIGIGNDAKWLGSVYRCGEIWAITTPILLQINQVIYEEMVIDYIKYCKGVIGDHVCKWPWDWMDSRMTPYSYTFIPEYNKVYMSIEGEDLVDPIKIIQGMDLIEASTMIGPPMFPIMIDKIPLEELDKDGYKSPIII